MNELVPNHWVDPVDGVIPEVGYRVSWDALWADFVVGVSAENLVNGGQPRVRPELMLDYLQNKLNSTQVQQRAHLLYVMMHLIDDNRDCAGSKATLLLPCCVLISLSASDASE